MRLRRVLVTAQVALSLVLLIGAGVFARSLANLLHYDLGFRPERLLVFSINPALSGYQSAGTASWSIVCAHGWPPCRASSPWPPRR